MRPQYDMIFDAVVVAPFGAVGLALAGGQVHRIELSECPLACKTTGASLAHEASAQIGAYLLRPEMALEFPVRVTGTPFQRRVWQAIREIPLGATCTYTELAQRVGSGPRAVANACGANPLPLLVPCHRVVGRSGLGGFMQGGAPGPLAIKRWLLIHERAIAG